MSINFSEVGNLLQNSESYEYLKNKLMEFSKTDFKHTFYACSSTGNTYTFDWAPYCQSAMKLPDPRYKLSIQEFERTWGFTAATQVASFLLLKLYIIILMCNIGEQCNHWDLRLNSRDSQWSSIDCTGLALYLDIVDDDYYGHTAGKLCITWMDKNKTPDMVGLILDPLITIWSPKKKEYDLRPSEINKAKILEILKS